SLIRAPASGPHAKAADAAKGRLHPHQPAVAGWVAHGAASIGTDRGQSQRCGDGSTRAAAGGARATCEVPRVAAAHGARGVPPDLGDDFAHQDTTGRFQECMQRGALLGPVVDAFGITEGGTDAFSGDNVLERVGDAVQGTALLAPGDLVLSIAGTLHSI